MVSEFLRSTAAEKLGLPRVATLLVPVGRTMQDVDIVGLTEDGTHVYVQVTYRERADAETERKLSILCDLVGQGKKAVLACRGCQQSHEDGVAVVPLETIYEQFTRTDAGTKWLDAVMGWLYPDGLHEGRPIVRG